MSMTLLELGKFIHYLDVCNQGDNGKSFLSVRNDMELFTVLSNLFRFVSCTFCKLFLTWILNHGFNIKQNMIRYSTLE